MIVFGVALTFMPSRIRCKPVTTTLSSGLSPFSMARNPSRSAPILTSLVSTLNFASGSPGFFSSPGCGLLSSST